MKTEEDEAFDELARRQGSWGGGFPAKRAMAADKLGQLLADNNMPDTPTARAVYRKMLEDDDDIQDYITANPDAMTIVYQSGYHDGKKAALAGREWNFCERCGKRTKDMTTIHTCTPPQEGK